MADGSAPIETEVKVRLGTPDEVDEVMRLALLGADENGFLTPNPAKILNDVWAALNLEAGAVGVIGELGEPLEGAVLLRAGPLWYSDDTVIDERAIYVDRDYREAKGGRGRKLVEFSEFMSDRLGLPLCIGVLSTIRTAAKLKMYSRLLGPQGGAYWIYWPKGHASHVDLAK
jgi:hypothetical protein